MGKLFEGTVVVLNYVESQEVQERVKAVLEENGATVYLKEEDVMDPSVDFYFVLDNFDGPLFEQLKRKKKYLIGVQCIYDSIERNKPLPKSENPVFSRALEGIKITCSKNIQKQKITLLVQYMNGIYQPELEDDTNYLIATETSSNKYQRAVKKGVLVIHPSWLLSCWQERSFVDTPNYVLKPFAGCIISVTGLGTGMRNMIQQLVHIFGGSFSPNLNKRCTHLIANSPAGVKYRYARSWGIPIITVEWLFDSLKMNVCANPDNYRLGPLPSLSLYSGVNEHKRSLEASNSPPVSSRFSLLSSARRVRSGQPETDNSPQSVFGDLEKLIELINNITERAVTVENCCELLVKASSSKHENLRNACVAMILDQYEAVQSTPGYAKLDDHLKKEIEDELNSSASLRTKRRRIDGKVETLETAESTEAPNNDQ
jgi:hypothetical protein